MRYARFIVTISLVFAVGCAFACGPNIYPPSGYYLFHLVDLPDNPAENYNLNSNRNCQLWQQQTSASIPLDDIYRLVYKFDIETLNGLKSHIIPEEVKGNQMAQWLVDHGADVNRKDIYGRTPASLPMPPISSEVIEYLIAHGAK